MFKSKDTVFKWMKKPFDLLNRKTQNTKINEEGDGTTRVSTHSTEDSINISRLNDLVLNRVWDFDSKIIKYEQRKDQALLNLPDLIEKYRELAQETEIEEAISLIAEEAVYPDYDNEVLSLNLIDLEEKYNEEISDEIRESYEKIMEFLDFNKNVYKYWRDWYIDGRIVFEAVYEEDNIKAGIKDIVQVDPIKIKRFNLERENKIFYELEEVDYAGISGFSGLGTFGVGTMNKSYNVRKVILDERFITYVHSGHYDKKLNTYTSLLHSALAPMNKLKLLEMSLLVYRLARAPERRVFYIDTYGLPPTKAEQYINNLMMKFKNESTFNDGEDEIVNRRNVMSFTKDFYIPVEGGSSGTRVDSLPGAANLGELGDLDYFYNKLKKSLKIPKSRWDDDGGRYTIGRSNEITQEEVRFSKFIKTLRNSFVEILYDLIKKDLLARNIIQLSEWKKIKKYIKFNWNKSNHFDELLDQEILSARVDILTKVEPYIGKYFTHKDVFKDILKYNDERMDEVMKENNLNIDNLSLMDQDAENVEGGPGGGDFGGGDFGGGDFGGGDFGDDFGDEGDFDVDEEEFTLDDFDEEGGEEGGEETPEETEEPEE